jgi:hypothetical protein
MAGAATGECFTNDGTGQDPDLWPSSCLVGDFQVVHVLPGTTDTSGCDGIADDDWNVPDEIGDQVLCLSYLDASTAYNAVAGGCVFGPPGTDQGWSAQPCQIGNFTVRSRYMDWTGSSVCGSGSDYYVSFTVGGYPGLNVALCLEMNYGAAATAPLNTCVLQTGSGSDERFWQTSCGDADDDANVYVVTGRVWQYDDPSWCGSYASVWWEPPGYPGLGLTTCLAPAS